METDNHENELKNRVILLGEILNNDVLNLKLLPIDGYYTDES